jgi:hypothetical protein
MSSSIQDTSVVYIQIPEASDAAAFVVLAKSGGAVTCLPEIVYGVQPEHLRILRRRHVPFKKIDVKKIRLPKRGRAA